MVRMPIPVFNYKVVNKGGKTLDVFVDGDIVDASTQEILRNWWGDETSTSYKSFRNQIEDASPDVLNIYINSPGGHVGDALAIHDYLNELQAKGVTVNRKGRGIIASAGTYLLMGDNSEMSENSFMMIHNVSMVAYGDINQVENQAKAGRKFNDKIRDFYATMTGNAPEQITKWMNAETWMTADEAVQRNFVKAKTETVQFTNCISADAFPYTNNTFLNQYNSQIKNLDMATIKETVTALVNSALEAAGFKNKESKEVNKLIDDLSNTFEGEIKNASGMKEEDIKTLITNSIKDFATKEDIKNLIKKEDIVNFVEKKDIANFATKDDLKTKTDEIIDAINGKAGSATSGNSSEEEKKTANTKKTGGKYANLTYSDLQASKVS